MWRHNHNRRLPRKLSPCHAAAWRRNHDHLLAFVEREGHAKVPGKHKEGDCALGRWAQTQRTKWRKGELLEEHRELLERVRGWDWGREGLAQMPVEKEPRHGNSEWNFIQCGDGYRMEIVSFVLLGEGPLQLGNAVTLAIGKLFTKDLEPERHFREGGRTRWLVKRAIRHGLGKKKLDQPGPGLIRGVDRDAKLYSEDEWTSCIQQCAFFGPVTRGEIVQRTLDSAVDLMGLKLSTVPEKPEALARLQQVIDQMIESGEIEVRDS